MAIIYLTTGSVLTLFDTAEYVRPDNLKVEILEQKLNLSQSVHYTPIKIDVNQTLGLTQSAQNRVIEISVGNFLQLSDHAAKIVQLYVNNHLILTQVARTVLHETIEQKLNLTQDVLVTRGLSQSLTLQQNVSYLIVRSIPIEQTLNLTQGVSVYKSNNASFVLDPVSAVPNYSPIIVSFGSTSLTLVVPEFGDADVLEHHRIDRETRAGDRIIFRDTIWPKSEILKFTLHGLSEAQSKNLLSFIDESLGQTVTLTDHWGVSWSGTIINPDLEIEQVNGHDCAGFVTELQFEGTRI